MVDITYRTFYAARVQIAVLLLLQYVHHTTQHLHDSHPGDSTPNIDNCAQHLDPNDTTTIDLRLNRAKVPNHDTTYMCQTFDLPRHQDLHMIAVLPLIDVEVVVHHIILFGCDPRLPRIQDTARPEICSIMPVTSCRSLIGTWTMGSSGDCAHHKMGFRVGPHGYTQVFMQVHYNNPDLLNGTVDSSGLRLHFTGSLRPNDAGMLIVGQRSLQINPLEYEDRGQGSYSINENMETHYISQTVNFTADCPSRCTQHMFGEKGVYITSAVNHMHTLGVSQRIQVFRNNTLIHTITDQQDYNYNHPVIYTFLEPLHVLPGDEIKTTCTYKRPKSQHPVCFGEATSDEMCFGFITYFPSQNLKYPWCTSMGSMKSCDRHLPQLGLQPINGCKWWEFRNLSRTETKIMFMRVIMSCYSGETLDCSQNCKSVVNSIISHPCMQNDVGAYMIDRIKNSGQSGQKLMEALLTCSCRHFQFCDRRLPKRLLGNLQYQWCPSNAPVTSVRLFVVLCWSILSLFYDYRLI